MAKFLLIEAYDFDSYPTGGSGSFSNRIIKSFGQDVALVGITTQDSDIVGIWKKKIISGMEYDYFPVKYVKKQNNKKPFIPERLSWYLELRKYKKEILCYGCSNVFVQSPDTLLVIFNWKFKHVCYRFAGLTNPLSFSRYKWARIFDGLFEKVFIPKLKYVNTFLAAASKLEIFSYCQKLSNYGLNIKISQFPTRVDTDIFYPMNKKNELKKKLFFSSISKIIVTSGRLSEVKGWKLLIDSYKLFQNNCPDSNLLFIGDGPDKAKIEAYIFSLGMQGKIKLVGFQNSEHLAEYLNIADLYVMGSFFEGWPTSMVEALACGIPICSTKFGSSKEIINNEKIGMIASDRNPEIFALNMRNSMDIRFDEKTHSQEIEKYSLKNLKKDLLAFCDFL